MQKTARIGQYAADRGIIVGVLREFNLSIFLMTVKINVGNFDNMTIKTAKAFSWGIFLGAKKDGKQSFFSGRMRVYQLK